MWLTSVSLRRDIATRPKDSKQRVSLHGLFLHVLAPTGYAPVVLCYWLKQNSPKREACQISLYKTHDQAVVVGLCLKAAVVDRTSVERYKNKNQLSTILLMFLPKADQLMQINTRP